MYTERISTVDLEHPFLYILHSPVSLKGFEYIPRSIDERDTSACATALLGNYTRFCLPKRDLLFPSFLFLFIIQPGRVHRKLYKRDRHRSIYTASPSRPRPFCLTPYLTYWYFDLTNAGVQTRQRIKRKMDRYSFLKLLCIF
jgi:hypothetical protein